MVLRLVKAESFKLSKKLKSWLGPLLIMVLVLIAFPLSIDISQFDLAKFFGLMKGTEAPNLWATFFIFTDSVDTST